MYFTPGQTTAQWARYGPLGVSNLVYQTLVQGTVKSILLFHTLQQINCHFCRRQIIYESFSSNYAVLLQQ